MSEKSIRFAITDGHDRRAATWKCWALTGKGNSDFYLACREIGSELKVSLHQSGNWHVAFTNEFWAQTDNHTDKPEKRIFMKRPRPSQFAKGMTLAFQIITPYSAVDIPMKSLPKDTLNIPAAPTGMATEIAGMIVEPNIVVTGWPGKKSMNTSLVDSVQLDNGDTVWLVYYTVNIPELGTLKGKCTFLNGKTESDLKGTNIRGVIFADSSDGSITLVDCIGSGNY